MTITKMTTKIIGKSVIRRITNQTSVGKIYVGFISYPDHYPANGAMGLLVRRKWKSI